jgi:peroxiredoxin
MAVTPSSMLPLGTPAPDFRLPEVTDGRTWSLADFADADALLVMFICRHCPYVRHVEDELVRLGRDHEHTGLAIVAISSNDAANYPDDAPDSLAEQKRWKDFRFPYLYDQTQAVARDYSATCTPDFFLFDRERRLAYRGQLDDSRPGDGRPVTGQDLRSAIDAVLAGQRPAASQKPSIGCNIKWKMALVA